MERMKNEDPMIRQAVLATAEARLGVIPAESGRAIGEGAATAS
jgi:hypothetical protein